jgi:hypothetical protein
MNINFYRYIACILGLGTFNVGVYKAAWPKFFPVDIILGGTLIALGFYLIQVTRKIISPFILFLLGISASSIGLLKIGLPQDSVVDIAIGVVLIIFGFYFIKIVVNTKEED